jgi:PAS domain S-box-containing protein
MFAVRSSILFRGTALLAAAIVVAVAWTVERTVQQADESNRLVLHTQEVLAQIEKVLGTLVAAEASVNALPVNANLRIPDDVAGADRRVDAELDGLTRLTIDNPDQHRRIERLRDNAREALAAVHALAETKRRAVPGPDALESEHVTMDGAREIAQEMRLEENRLLRERANGDVAATRRLRWAAIAVLFIAVGLLVGILWMLRRDSGRKQRATEELRRAKVSLETEVGARTAELRDSTARLQSIIDSAVDGIIVIDAKGRVEAFNRGAERLFGYAAEEVIGRNVSMLMPSPYHEEHDGYLARYLETGVAKIIGAGRQVSGRRRDGTTFPLHLSVGEMSIQGERKFTGMLHDLTERMRLDSELRASEARWRAIVQSAVDGIVVIDAHGRIEAFNAAAERLFGYAESDLIGRNVNVLMPSPYQGEHDIYLARYLATGAKKIIGMGREVTGLRRDGTTFPLHLSVGELTVNGERKFTGILHDLSVRVQMEEQLREQASLVRLGEMAAVLAHEIKNPLAGIRGAIQVIGGRLPEGSRDAGVVKEVVARIDGLNDLMKDLLLFARPPQPKPSPVELSLLLASIADLLASDPALNGLEVKVEGSAPLIDADPELLKIVFGNLLVNGAHAMEGRGTIRVSLSVTGNTCQLVFRDSGPGIPADVREKIFTPFFTTKARGSGLGLPTAKRLIEAHRGSISISCPPGGGTSVTVELPTRQNVAGV